MKPANQSIAARLFDTPADPRDFAPALMRARENPPSPFAGWMLKVILLLFGCLLAWAALSKLDIVAVATGKLVPQTYLRIVQPFEQGIVKEILVSEGESVKAGQVLLRMDPRLTDADRRTVENDFKLKQSDRNACIRRDRTQQIGYAVDLQNHRGYEWAATHCSGREVRPDAGHASGGGNPPGHPHGAGIPAFTGNQGISRGWAGALTPAVHPLRVILA